MMRKYWNLVALLTPVNILGATYPTFLGYVFHVPIACATVFLFFYGLFAKEETT
jgi:4-hydroxybenzoate polyprenyltransferase